MSNSFVGGFYIPTELEDINSGRRTYRGIGDPNHHMESAIPFFIPSPRPEDRYLQLETDPMIEWVFTSDGYWAEISNRYDTEPPDHTAIHSVKKS